MNIGDYLNNLNKEKLDSFVDNTDSSIVVKKNVNKQISDTSWIDMVEDCIPYLDNIIRNPRRFIVQEENIVPIEKTKVVTEESIRHLAQHTQLIQDVKEDGRKYSFVSIHFKIYRKDGTLKPRSPIK